MNQSIILVIDRKSNHHLVDFCASSGRKYTLCELVYHKKNTITTLTIDDVYEGICPKCKEIYERELSAKALAPRRSKGNLLGSLRLNYTEARDQMSDKELNQMDRKDRIWDKMNKYKRKLRIDRRK